MADIAARIEADTTRLMQGWLHRDPGILRKLIHRDCTFMIGSHPPQLLDRPSFLAATEDGGFRCNGFQLGDALIKRYNNTVWSSCGARLELSLGREEWAGSFLITDLWRKSWGGWKLIERSLATTAIDEEHKIAMHLRALQLWR